MDCFWRMLAVALGDVFKNEESRGGGGGFGECLWMFLGVSLTVSLGVLGRLQGRLWVVPLSFPHLVLSPLWGLEEEAVLQRRNKLTRAPAIKRSALDNRPPQLSLGVSSREGPLHVKMARTPKNVVAFSPDLPKLCRSFVVHGAIVDVDVEAQEFGTAHLLKESRRSPLEADQGFCRKTDETVVQVKEDAMAEVPLPVDCVCVRVCVCVTVCVSIPCLSQTGTTFYSCSSEACFHSH